MIGVHTPEFAFERNVDNVRRAVREMNIEYPIVIDNDYSIWRGVQQSLLAGSLSCRCAGTIRHTHFGEGEYDRSEKAIQQLLSEAGVGVPSDGLVSLRSRRRRAGRRLGQPAVS